jgi:DNA-binding NarL/FixJ family response regulator
LCSDVSQIDSNNTNPSNNHPKDIEMTIRVFLVDDHWEVREKLRILLMKEADFELIGEAADGSEAIEALRQLDADVVIMDLNLPEISGVETSKRILADRPDAKVIIVSIQSDPHYVKESFKSGATGYILKDCAFEELVEAVHIVAAGATYVSPEIEVKVP